MDDVCVRSIDPQFCLNEFGRNPAAKQGTLPQIASLATATAESNATAAETKIRTLLREATNERLKNALHKCYVHYIDALTDLQIAARDISSQNYEDLNFKARSASQHGKSCHDLFMFPILPLNAENRSLWLLGNIIEIVSLMA